MKKLLAAIAAIMLTFLSMGVAHAETKSGPRNVGIKGVWVGTNYGFENGLFKNTDLRWTVEKVNGVTFAGVKSFREVQTGEWSEPEPFMGIMYKNGEFHAVDSDGVIIGKRTSPNKIRASYLKAAGDNQDALVMKMTKASR
jgi:hypothetical protein